MYVWIGVFVQHTHKHTRWTRLKKEREKERKRERERDRKKKNIQTFSLKYFNDASCNAGFRLAKSVSVVIVVWHTRILIKKNFFFSLVGKTFASYTHTHTHIHTQYQHQHSPYRIYGRKIRLYRKLSRYENDSSRFFLSFSLSLSPSLAKFNDQKKVMHEFNVPLVYNFFDHCSNYESTRKYSTYAQRHNLSNANSEW